MQHAEKKGETIKNLWVIRRVGGLEEDGVILGAIWSVIRRVGGLEDPLGGSGDAGRVIRRVGGLEVPGWRRPCF